MTAKRRKKDSVKIHQQKIYRMRKRGCTFREIAEHFGFKNKYVVKGFLKREREKAKRAEMGLPQRWQERKMKQNLVNFLEK
jgi:transcriptional regulator